MPLLIAVPGPAQCRTCSHYEPGSPTAGAGTCRIKAPIVLAEGNGTCIWPRVAEYERCGEHTRRFVPAEAI